MRNSNMDLLRLISMIMVTMLHALTKSELLPFMGDALSANGLLAWTLEAMSVSAVNIYMLISGYFLINSKFKVGRLAEIILQTFFYSAGVTLFFGVMGAFDLTNMSIYQLLPYVFPIQMETYWFISAYVILYLMLPLLSSGIHGMSEKQLNMVIWGLLILECGIKSISPVRFTLDHKGYSFLWYLTMFLVGAKIRLYGLKFIKSARRGWTLYFISTVLILTEIFVLSRIQVKTGHLKEIATVSLEYNHIFVFLSAVGIFSAFLYAKPLENKFGKAVSMLSPYCLGVYLLQESLVMRYSWQEWLGLKGLLDKTTLRFFFRICGAVFVMFAVGICVDAVRTALFRICARCMTRGDKRE